jgi:hypothetical protein
MKPTPNKRITDPAFKYIPAAQTDLKKTFARIRREQALARKTTHVVVPIKKEEK